MGRKNPEGRLAYLRAYHHAHRDIKNARRRVRYMERREEELANRREQHKVRRNERLTQQAQYRQAHREEARIRTRAWERANPERANQNKIICKQRRRARLAQAPLNNLTRQQWEEIKSAYGYKCVYCGRKMKRLSMDHITPIIKGGSHTVTNIVPACRPCNSRKHAGPPLKPVQPLLLTIA